MRIDGATRLWCLGCAALVAAQIFLLDRLPFPLLDPGDTVFHVLAFTSLSMMLCIAFGIRFPKLGEKSKCAE
jgi:drug/metabolite transporter (DMT)-like permease